MFSSLDLFSGLGGNAFAIKSIAAPALYCEVDAAAANLLKNAMKGGLIPTAPVHGSICNLMETQAYAQAKAMRPLLLSASWPCQGASKLGKRKGMDDSRSGLLRELCTVMPDAMPDVASFENVPDVVSNGSLEYTKEAGLPSRTALTSVMVHKRSSTLQTLLLPYQPSRISIRPPDRLGTRLQVCSSLTAATPEASPRHASLQWYVCCRRI